MLFLPGVGEVCARTITHRCAADGRTALRVREWLRGAPLRGKVRWVGVRMCRCVMMHVRDAGGREGRKGDQMVV